MTDFLADAGSASGHLVDYLYLGLSAIVQQAGADGIELTSIAQAGGGDITTGDQYAGDE